MNITDLIKEKKQYVILGGVVAVVLVLLIVFGVRISLSSLGVAKGELEDLTGKIEGADRSLAKRYQSKEEFVETSAELRGHLQYFPPKRNYYSWATEIIYSTARLANLEIDAIDEQAGSKKTNTEGKDAGGINMESYSLRITSRGGYINIKAFLEQIEEHQPLARVTGVDICTGANADIHDVQLFIQWPFNLNAITEAWEAIAEQQEALDKHDSIKAGPAQPTKAIEPKDPAPVSESLSPSVELEVSADVREPFQMKGREALFGRVAKVRSNPNLGLGINLKNQPLPSEPV